MEYNLGNPIIIFEIGRIDTIKVVLIIACHRAYDSFHVCKYKEYLTIDDIPKWYDEKST